MFTPAYPRFVYSSVDYLYRRHACIFLASPVFVMCHAFGSGRWKEHARASDSGDAGARACGKFSRKETSALLFRPCPPHRRLFHSRAPFKGPDESGAVNKGVLRRRLAFGTFNGLIATLSAVIAVLWTTWPTIFQPFYWRTLFSLCLFLFDRHSFFLLYTTFTSVSVFRDVIDRIICPLPHSDIPYQLFLPLRLTPFTSFARFTLLSFYGFFYC